MKKALLVIGVLTATALAAKAKGLFTLADNLRIFIHGLGKLSISNSFLRVPFKVQIDNNSNDSLKVERVLITVFIQDDGEFVPIGSSSPDSVGFQLQPNKTHNYTFTPNISLIQLGLVIGADLIINLGRLKEFLKEQVFKIETKFVVAGKTIDKETIINQPDISI